MSAAPLLVVEERFAVASVGLVVSPFALSELVPEGATRELFVRVEHDGETSEHLARLSWTHFRWDASKVFAEGEPTHGWRVVLAFPDATKDDVPVGARPFEVG